MKSTRKVNNVHLNGGPVAGSLLGACPTTWNARQPHHAARRTRMAIAGAILTVASLSAPIYAHAQSWFEYEASIGYTHYQDDDGRWVQEGAPIHSLQTSSIALGAGLTGDLWSREHWGVSYHLDYEYMGTASASCMCTSDENYSRAHHSFIDPDGPTTSFAGSGHTQGAVVSIEPWYQTHGWRIGVEAGAFFHFDTWNETVANSARLSAPTGMHIAPMAGLSISYGALALQWRHYFMNGQLQAENVPPLWRGIDTIQLVYKRSF